MKALKSLALSFLATSISAQSTPTPSSTLDVYVPSPFPQLTSRLPAPNNPRPSLLSAYYVTIPTLPPAISTSLAHALYSVEQSFEANPTYASAHAALVSTAPDTEVKRSLARNGYNYHVVTTAAWFGGVSKGVESLVADKFATVLKVEGEVYTNNSIPAPAKGGAGTIRGSGMAVLGAVVVVGGFLVVL
ncbi:hypothetical protein HYALB_00013606 [Hymenoscyphus albidus]|uniref:Inhibitor I9 domain-containing protein n=1 Tax=Hymenoscyphus albidus TaxID=595503 RepID=A0A9N9LZ38_9HELO|nr:hypothetical protein HYALB_00013606 [Hymenoscyphus albidus]